MQRGMSIKQLVGDLAIKAIKREFNKIKRDRKTFEPN
jgi:hypothetical protein